MTGVSEISRPDRLVAGIVFRWVEPNQDRQDRRFSGYWRADLNRVPSNYVRLFELPGGGYILDSTKTEESLSFRSLVDVEGQVEKWLTKERVRQERDAECNRAQGMPFGA
jgi:hypothetical protein